MAAKRILKEIRDLDSSPHDEFAAGPNSQDDLFRWTATLNGPKGTPYDGGAFYIDIRLPPEYPFKPPRMQFITKIYHPNVDYQGSMSIDILCEKWSPALTTKAFNRSLIASPARAARMVCDRRGPQRSTSSNLCSES